MAQYHSLRGNWINEDGTFERGSIQIERDGDVLRCDCGGMLTAKIFAVVPGINDVNITSSHGAWAFCPDDGECERVGLAITA